MDRSPAFLELRRVETAREIATTLARSRNRVFLESDTLLLNLTSGLDSNLEKKTQGGAIEKRAHGEKASSKK